MGKELIHDFIVDTGTICFLCLEETPRSPQSSDARELPVLPTSIHSLRSISRYLNITKRKVFQDRESIPPDLFFKVESSELKASLCNECIMLSERFSEQYRQLEKLEMEVTSRLEDIYKKLLGAGKMPQQIQNLAHSNQQCIGKLKIAEVLRTEAIQKCRQKLSIVQPRVKVQLLSDKTILENSLQLECNPSAPIFGNIKEESFDSDSIRDECQNDYLDDLEEQNWHRQATLEQLPTLTASPKVEFTDGMEGDSSQVNLSADTSHRLNRGAWKSKRKDGKTPTSFNHKTGKYACSLCFKEFTLLRNCEAHYRIIHLNIRYKCDLCGKKFQLNSYQRHRRSVHLGVKYKCKSCGKSFKQKGSLKKHIKTVH